MNITNDAGNTVLDECFIRFSSSNATEENKDVAKQLIPKLVQAGATITKPVEVKIIKACIELDLQYEDHCNEKLN
jgi:hypothetical protein